MENQLLIEEVNNLRSQLKEIQVYNQRLLATVEFSERKYNTLKERQEINNNININPNPSSRTSKNISSSHNIELPQIVDSLEVPPEFLDTSSNACSISDSSYMSSTNSMIQIARKASESDARLHK